MMVSTTPMNIIPTWMTTTGTARPSMARSSSRRGASRPAATSNTRIQDGLEGTVEDGSRGWASRRSAKSSLSASSETSARSASTSWDRTSAPWTIDHPRVPAAHPPAVGIAEVTGGDDDEIGEPPDPEAAQRGQHERTAARLAEIEPVGTEGAQQGGERRGHPAGLIGGIRWNGEVVHANNISGKSTIDQCAWQGSNLQPPA